MQIFEDIAPIREQIKKFKANGSKIAFVPTMGNLHDGHLALIRKARENADIVVVSIFVNPMQFDRTEDLNNYPRTLDEDLSKLNAQAVELVFTPNSEILYPDGIEQQSIVDVPHLSTILEGVSRPGHFVGVATVVTKLFNIITPDVAVFGEKDFQQLAVLKKMVQDLQFDIEILSLPTVREIDGLAMSSRNNLLTIDERQRAPVIARTMRWISSAIRSGRDDYNSVITDAHDQLRAADLIPDEIFIRDANTLYAITEASTQAVILMSAFIGTTRLVDNLVIDLIPEPKEEANDTNN